MGEFIIHSSMGGDVLLESNDALEHKSVTANYPKTTETGLYGSKNTGRGKYDNLYKAADEAAIRTATRTIESVLEKAKGSLNIDSGKAATINNRTGFRVTVEDTNGNTFYNEIIRTK